MSKVALITGIFERLIHAIKSFNGAAIRLLFKGKIKELIVHVDLYFLISVFSIYFLAETNLYTFSSIWSNFSFLVFKYLLFSSLGVISIFSLCTTSIP